MRKTERKKKKNKLSVLKRKSRGAAKSSCGSKPSDICARFLCYLVNSRRRAVVLRCLAAAPELLPKALFVPFGNNSTARPIYLIEVQKPMHGAHSPTVHLKSGVI